MGAHHYTLKFLYLSDVVSFKHLKISKPTEPTKQFYTECRKNEEKKKKQRAQIAHLKF